MHSIHPLTKLYLATFIVLASFGLGLVAQVFLLVLLASICLSVPENKLIFKRLTRYILPAVILILVLDVLIYPESQKTIKLLGLTLNQAGLLFGLRVSLRLTNISLALLFFFSTTPVHILAAALLTKGLNPRIVYVFVYSLQLIGTLRRKVKSISIAQTARGLNVRGNPMKRLKAFFAMLFPLIFSYLSESLERGLALELRGLGRHGPKTFLIELPESRAERTANRLLLLAMALLIVWKIAQWLFL